MYDKRFFSLNLYDDDKVLVMINIVYDKELIPEVFFNLNVENYSNILLSNNKIKSSFVDLQQNSIICNSYKGKYSPLELFNYFYREMYKISEDFKFKMIVI